MAEIIFEAFEGSNRNNCEKTTEYENPLDQKCVKKLN